LALPLQSTANAANMTLPVQRARPALRLTKQRQWRAYAASIELEGVSLVEVVEAVWALVAPSCQRIAGS